MKAYSRRTKTMDLFSEDTVLGVNPDGKVSAVDYKSPEVKKLRPRMRRNRYAMLDALFKFAYGDVDYEVKSLRQHGIKGMVNYTLKPRRNGPVTDKFLISIDSQVNMNPGDKTQVLTHEYAHTQLPLVDDEAVIQHYTKETLKDGLNVTDPRVREVSRLGLNKFNKEQLVLKYHLYNGRN